MENIRIALRSIRGQLLRTVLTILIIAFGIMSLVGMLTAIDVLKQNISTNFAFLGANTFIIKNNDRQMSFSHGDAKRFELIELNEAKRFINRYAYPAKTSIHVTTSRSAVVQYKNEKTHPNTKVVGVAGNYLTTAGFKLDEGRYFTKTEQKSGANVAIIGSAIKKNIFKTERSIGKEIWINNNLYRIIAVIESKGSGLASGQDRICIIPINSARANYQTGNESYRIGVKVKNAETMDAAIGEAVATFRVIRGDKPGKHNSFGISKSDNLIKELLGMTKYLSTGSIVIALITLTGALVGLLNMMLVSVKERTQEIGIRKATGATRRSISNQFLTEAIVICQIGGALGIFFGILIGNVLTIFMGGSFVVPWNWVIIALIICFIVGISAGFGPARKAAKLNPIDTLRYE